MSFGFGVGDFMATGQLAWRLYRDYYRVARVAPTELGLLREEIGTLSNAIKILQEEVDNDESILRRSGEDRIRMVNEMMGRVADTLKELDKVSKKYDKLLEYKDKQKSKGKLSHLKEWRDKFMFSVDAPDLDALRNKLVYHNGVLNLLLTSVGNSSLQRLEATTSRIEIQVTEIKGYLRRAGTGNLSFPIMSHQPGLEDDDVFLASFSAILLENLPTTQHWASIGVSEWIGAGRWWLLKSQMEPYPEVISKETGAVSRRGYLNLVKAAWVLIDVVVRHPQLSYLDASVRMDVEALARTIREEFRSIESRGLQIPSLEITDDDDLRIWEAQTQRPTLRPGSKSEERVRAWIIADEHIVFQRFGHYQADHQNTPVASLVLLLVSKKQRSAHLIIYDQSWRCLADFSDGTLTASIIDCNGNSVIVGGQQVMLSAPLDAKLLHTMLLFYGKYFHLCVSETRWFDIANHSTFFLLVAMRASDTDVVRYLLEETKDRPQDEDLETGSCLFLEVKAAAQYFPPEAPNGANRASFLNFNEKSLLFWLIDMGYDGVTRQLLKENGIDSPECDLGDYFSPNNIVCPQQLGLLLFLLQEGLPGNASILGKRLLSLAASGGHTASVRVLLDNGADIQAQNSEYWMALHHAAGNGHESTVRVLLDSGAEIQATDKDGWTALHHAAWNGHESTVRVLLDSGAEIQAKVYDGMTALQCAARNGYEDTVRVFLDSGADIHAEDNDSQTALHRAAWNGHEVTVQVLLDSGADIHAKDKYDLTALHRATVNEQEAMIRVLLDSGADIHAKDFTGQTALHRAANAGHEATVRVLLDSGADIHAKDKNGQTALVLAEHTLHPDCATMDLLRNRAVTGN